MGSEMCIRDRHPTDCNNKKNQHPAFVQKKEMVPTVAQALQADDSYPYESLLSSYIAFSSASTSKYVVDL